MAAGIASLQMLEELNPYAKLDALGRQVCTAALAAAKTKGLPLQAPQAGSDVQPPLYRRPPRMPTALTSDAKPSQSSSNACLADGVYLPPSAYVLKLSAAIVLRGAGAIAWLV